MPRTATRPAGVWLASAAMFAVLAAPACGDDTGPPPLATLLPDPSFPGTPGDPAAFTDLFQFQPLDGCSVSNPAALAITTPLRIFRGPDVSDADVRAFLGALQRYYSQYGVAFSTAFDVIDVPLRQALSLDRDLLTARVRSETGVDIEATDSTSLPPDQQARVLEALGSTIVHNVRELLRVYATPRRPEFNLVLLPEMASGDPPPELQAFAGLLGLGVSPELFAGVAADDPAQLLYQWLAMPEPFTPTAIVGVHPVSEFLLTPDVAIAHELGHCYGLPHVTDWGDLMHPGEFDCQQSLSTEQLERVQADQ